MFNYKKGYTMRDLLPLVILFVVGVFAITIGSQIISGLAKNQCGSGYTWNESAGVCVNSTTGIPPANQAGMSAAGNVSIAGLQGNSTFGNYLPTIALVLMASIIIGILLTSFMTGKQ